VHATFFQKVCLTIGAGFLAACVIYLFTNVFEEFNDAVNKGYQTNTGMVAKSRR
jgi:hypothetical protein